MEKRIKKLRKEGYSYSEIANLVGRNKKFAWRKSKNVEFSKKGEKRYYENVKGIPTRIKPQVKRLTPIKVRIIGHLLFDGSVYKIINSYHKNIMYVNSSKELVNQFIDDIYQVYGIKPSSIEENKAYKRVVFNSKLMFNDLMNYFESYSTSNENTRIPKAIMNANKKIKIEFLKSFWEDEGSISAIGRLTGDSKNYNVIYQLKELMEELGFDLRICKYLGYTGYMHKIYLLKKEKNLKLFFDLGLFEKAKVTHGKNKGRKKLEVLKEAIQGFKNL